MAIYLAENVENNKQFMHHFHHNVYQDGVTIQLQEKDVNMPPHVFVSWDAIQDNFIKINAKIKY